MGVVTAQSSSAAGLVTVKVVIEKVMSEGCDDTLGKADFYGAIDIGGEVTSFDRIDDVNPIYPNWTAQRTLDVDASSTVPVTIRIGEYDKYANFDDDECDITQAPGRAITMTVQLSPCDIFQEGLAPSIGCDESITMRGNESESAQITYRVEVEEEAASSPGLNVRCMHTPLWPQPGDSVTITVEALEGIVNVGDTMADNSSGAAPALVNRARIADRLEIWVDDRSAPDLTESDKTRATLSTTVGQGGDLVYSCRVQDDGEGAFTGCAALGSGRRLRARRSPCSTPVTGTSGSTSSSSPTAPAIPARRTARSSPTRAR